MPRSVRQTRFPRRGASSTSDLLRYFSRHIPARAALLLASPVDSFGRSAKEYRGGRASEVVVGQILHNMGFVHQELAEPGQSVEGVIICTR